MIFPETGLADRFEFQNLVSLGINNEFTLEVVVYAVEQFESRF